MIGRLYQPRTPSRDHFADNIRTVRDPIPSHLPSDMYIRLSNPSTMLTNAKEIDKMNYIELKNTQIKLDNNNNEHTFANPR